jgi:hypothetical protein
LKLVLFLKIKNLKSIIFYCFSKRLALVDLNLNIEFFLKGVNVTLPADSHNSTTTIGVYREHFKQMITSKSYLGRIWHAIVLGAEVLFFPIAIIEVAFNRYRESSTLIGRKVKKASDSELFQYSSIIKNLDASVRPQYPISSIEKRDEILPVTFREETVAVGMNLGHLLTTPTTAVSSSNQEVKISDSSFEVGALELIPVPTIVEDALEVELSRNSTPSLVANKDLLLSFLKKHNFPAETIEQVLRELVKLSPSILNSFLKDLVSSDKALWRFVTFEIQICAGLWNSQIVIERKLKFLMNGAELTNMQLAINLMRFAKWLRLCMRWEVRFRA